MSARAVAGADTGFTAAQHKYRNEGVSYFVSLSSRCFFLL